jgi:hypothetical protein
MNVDWMADALCYEAAELPWIAEPEGVSPRAETAMRALCRGCPVLIECLSFVHFAHVNAGFWSGDFRENPDEQSIGGAA